MKRLLPIVFVALLGIAPARAACPTNHAYGGPYDWFDSNPVWDQGIVCGHVSVDLRSGWAQLSGGGGIGEQTCGAGLDVSDVYQLAGPPAGTPFAFTARIHLSGEVPASWFKDPYLAFYCHGSRVTSDLTVGSATDHFTDTQAGFDSLGCVTHAVSADRTFPLSKLPGETFTIRFQSNVSGYTTCTIRQTLTFEGLPPGYTIQSCQGYAAQPTPALARSWGSLKNSYR